MPESSELLRIRWTASDIPTEAFRANPNYIVWTDIEITGDPAYPDVLLRLHVWSVEKNMEIFNKGYKTALGLELFDSMDELLIQTVKSVFNIDVKIAYVNFQKFDIGNEAYRIYANNRPVTIISNSSQRFELKILADTTYNLMIERVADRTVVLNKDVKLKQNQSTNVTYARPAGLHANRCSTRRRQRIPLLSRRSEITQARPCPTSCREGT
jgi:hypothetical protein